MRNQALAGTFVCGAVENRICRQKWVAGEIHLCHEPGCECGAKYREVDVRRPLGIVVITPRIASRPDGDEPVAVLVIGESTIETSEIRIERGVVLILRVQVAACGIRLPNLHQGVWDRMCLVVEDPASNDNSFTQGSLLMLAGEICNYRPDVVGGEARSRDF